MVGGSLWVLQQPVYDRKECNACGVRTTRLDLHLIRVHGMERGEELLAVVKGRRVAKAHVAFHVYHKAFAPVHLTFDTS
jgi:hypothetical protein